MRWGINAAGDGVDIFVAADFFQLTAGGEFLSNNQLVRRYICAIKFEKGIINQAMGWEVK